MVTVLLSGGLGNQMFQYAAGRALSLEYKSELCLDLYRLKKKSKVTARNFELNIFSIQIKETTSWKHKLIVKAYPLLKNTIVGRFIAKQLSLFTDESAQAYSSQFAQQSANTILFGYFQNEQYFLKYSEQIRCDFRFRDSLTGKNALLAEMIRNSNSVSIHVRRGDYQLANSNLPVLHLSYYKRAVQFLKDRLDNPAFFVFSDDIEWCRSHLSALENMSNIHYVGWNQDEKSYLDMQLISLCKHNVIANSSFSWWGAWLNSNLHKIVVAPSCWYKKLSANNYPKGFIPTTWVVI